MQTTYQHKKELASRVDEISNTIGFVINYAKKHKLSRKKILQMEFNRVTVLNKYNLSHYFFIDQQNGGILVNSDKSIVGVNFLKSKNKSLVQLK